MQSRQVSAVILMTPSSLSRATDCNGELVIFDQILSNALVTKWIC